jgi:hypothetical protein
MPTPYSTLIGTLIGLLQESSFDVPQGLSKKGREEFVFHALENCKIVPIDWYDNLIGAAQAVVSTWATRSLAAAVRKLDAALRADGESISEPFVLIICQGGLVQEVIGLPARTYEVCDTDAFEDSGLPEAIQYFNDRSEPMKTYLRNSGWRSSLPEAVQNGS